ncbi:MAG: hypothetical protein JWO38_2467 [Gemmataceae bacterium]|nr:hypothetical protein [Gemmataceae bacterium]
MPRNHSAGRIPPAARLTTSAAGGLFVFRELDFGDGGAFFPHPGRSQARPRERNHSARGHGLPGPAGGRPARATVATADGPAAPGCSRRSCALRSSGPRRELHVHGNGPELGGITPPPTRQRSSRTVRPRPPQRLRPFRTPRHRPGEVCWGGAPPDAIPRGRAVADGGRNGSGLADVPVSSVPVAAPVRGTGFHYGIIYRAVSGSLGPGGLGTPSRGSARRATGPGTSPPPAAVRGRSARPCPCPGFGRVLTPSLAGHHGRPRRHPGYSRPVYPSPGERTPAGGVVGVRGTGGRTVLGVLLGGR